MRDEATALEERPPHSLAELVLLCKQADDGLEVGLDLATLGELTRDKVDALRFVRDRLRAEALWRRSEARRLSAIAQRLEKNEEDLCAYIVSAMQAGEFDLLSGNTSAIRLQASPPSLKTDKAPTADDHAAHKDLVTMTITYAWNKDALKERLKGGAVFTWARLEQGQHARFVDKKGGG